jgi:hypothetical protein
MTPTVSPEAKEKMSKILQPRTEKLALPPAAAAEHAGRHSKSEVMITQVVRLPILPLAAAAVFQLHSALDGARIPRSAFGVMTHALLHLIA